MTLTDVIPLDAIASFWSIAYIKLSKIREYASETYCKI